MLTIRSFLALPLLPLLALLLPLVSADPVPGLLPKIPILDALLALGASPPPPILRTTHPSPQCAAINQGQLMCCRATVAGDIQLVVWLAELYGYNLNPNDINGLNCDTNIDTCPGVKVCCQVTGLTPLLALWCHDYP
ncbi:hypothetical protein QBC33DRAFT_64815 [Phialemonium atrogriseum]|uniref:Hydrophobin n=1 Tax=Phialemonium atrogriseum TaxID=1093897 RepID=A0AAJ0C0L0_9PEZI|nr:uncharacterized protein QBC33DRAFT_64815 [Phialemonium atrogriseum]KAK1767297.1 hypothetical protein QBC33DRAFT_64815 [Phialemonium atrogriseum]